MYTAAVLTISTKGAQGQRRDTAGPVVSEMLRQAGFEVLFQDVLPDDQAVITARLVDLADEQKIDLILTAGGTGVAPSDITPEATLAAIDREVPGMAEAMRAASLQKTPHAMISRAMAGIRNQTLIINLPGSEKGSKENLEAVMAALPHAIDKIKGDQTDCAV